MHARHVARRPALVLRHLGASLALGATLALAACGDDGTGPDAGASKITVSGTLTGPRLAALQDGSHILVLWAVSATESDYGYVYGEGTIDRVNGRFTLTLPDRPPQEALNQIGSNYALGVGLIIVLPPSYTLPQGRVEIGDLPTEQVRGAAGQYAIIYTAGDPANAPAGWPRTFPRGYAVGHGVQTTDTFDIFEPTSASAVQITIDDIDNIEFTNWT